MKRILSLLLFMSIIIGASAQIPSGYYDDAEGLSGEALKSALHEIINGHNSQSYSSLWYHFESSDKKSNGKVWDMYSDVPGGTPPYEFNFGSDQCGNYGQESDCFNREHSFPKSWFNDASPMNTDMFHIVPTDGYVNGRRSNLPFGETNNPSWTSMNGCKTGSNSTSGYSGTIFEPIDAYKGDFARAYMYMATRYEDIIPGWENNSGNADAVLDGSSFPVFEEWFLDLLLDWHQNDPVSQKEIDRNNAIYDIQNNRNPYVDHIEYISLVWGGAQVPVITNVNHQPSSPEDGEVVTVNANITDNGNINSAQLLYGFESSNLSNTETMSASGSNYTAQIPGQSTGQQIYYRIKATDNENNTSQTIIYNYQVAQEPGYIGLPFFEDFNDETLGIFDEYSVSGPEQSWHNDDFNTDLYAKMSNYNGDDNIENEDWMISPAINFNIYFDEKMNFKSAMKDYDDNNVEMDLLYSLNYSGTGDPNNATWISLTNEAYWSQGDYEWVESGEIDLSGIVGDKVYIAFRYDSQAGSGKTWQIDDIGVDADPTGVVTAEKENFLLVPNPAKEYFYINSSDNNSLEITIIDASGKVIMEHRNTFAGQKLNVSKLFMGYYLVRIKSKDDVQTLPLIIK